MAVKDFQGADRRKIAKCLDSLESLLARDVLALNTATKRTSISTRSIVFDLSDAPTLAATTAVKAALINALAATR